MSAKRVIGSLKRLGYKNASNIDEGSLEYLFENETLVPFLDWLADSLQKAESLSKDEIQIFQRIKDSGKVILEGEELRRAIATMPFDEGENLDEEDLKAEIQHMKEIISNATRDLKNCLEQRNHLNLLKGEVSNRIGDMDLLTAEVKEEYKKSIEQAHSDSVCLDSRFEELGKQVLSMINLHEDESETQITSNLFPSQVATDEYFLQEEQFTGALTSFTRRQFFEGIADMAGAKDKSQYQLLELSNPEFLLVRGERDNVTQGDCKELARLQTSYVDNEGCYIDTMRELKRCEMVLTRSETQLSTEILQPPNLDIHEMRVKLDDLQREYTSKTSELERLFDENLSNLLSELGELQAAKVLRGNYDLKIARQDYFTSKQDKVIKQLLLQNARYDYLSMLYEVEGKAKRDAYNMLSTARSLLDKEVTACESRLSLMEADQSRKKASRETVDSRDHLMHKLYSAFEDQSTESNTRLYVTFSLLQERFNRFHDHVCKGKISFDSLTQDRERCMSQLEHLVTDCKSLVYGYTKGDQLAAGPQQLSHLITKLEDVLMTLEKSIKDVIRDVEGKKKLLATDSLKALERTLFPSFFNDPTRLKRLIANLKSRVDAMVIH